MLIIRGVNVFPSQIEEAILSVSGIEPHYMIIVDREGHLDTLEVLVEVNTSSFEDEIRELEELRHKLQAKIEHITGISIRVRLVEPKASPQRGQSEKGGRQA
jgi:phenylacetate-CoA ligase